MGLYILALFLFGLAASGIAEKVTLTQINVDKSDHAARVKRSGRLMPKNLSFRMEDENGLYVVLNLTKIDLPATTIIKGGKSVKFFASGEDVATYVDFNRDGVFMLGLRRNPQGEIRYEMIGTFQFGKRRVSINPDPIIRTVYNIEDGDDIVDYRGDSIYPPGYVPPTIRPLRQSRALTNYIIEVCFIADYAIYQKFFTKNANDAIATQTEMSTYYAFHAEQLRVRYKTVQETDPSFSISIVNSGLVVYADPADIPFVETHKVGDTINSSLILSEFRDYINNLPAGITIPDSDHYMLFSGYDLVSASGSNSNAGLAYTDVMCSTYTMSLVEDTRRERSAITAAHELAHGIGSGHDSNEGCDNADQFIMTAVSGAITSIEMAIRRYTFSPCSVAAFKRSLDGTDCLFDNRYGDGELSSSPRLGQIYSKDDQCRFAVADNSSYFGANPGEECYKLKCVLTQNAGSVSFRSVLPLDYTDCGTDLWCVHGECVAKPATEPPVNLSPTITNLPTAIDVAENENGVVFTITSSDPESDPINYSYKWNSPNNADTYFDFNTQTGEISVKPGSNIDYTALQNTVFNVTVTATDGAGGASASKTLILRITEVAPPNTVPVITNTVTTVQIPESVPTTQTIVDVEATDADPGDSTTFTANWVNPTNGANLFDFNPTTGVITKKPGAILTGGQTYTVEVTATDGKDTSATKTFNIQVTAAVNQPPVLSNPPNSGTEVVQLTSLTPTGTIFDFNGADPEGSPVQYIVDSATPNDASTYFTMNPSTGEVTSTGIPLPPSTTFTLKVKVSDGTLDSAPGTVIINTPAAVNQPPVLTNPPNSGTEVVQLTSLTPTGTIFDFNGSDPEGSPVQYIVDSATPNDASTYFTINPYTGEVTSTGVPLPPSTTFTLKVKVSDGTLDSAPGTVIINTPAAVNQPPVLTNPPNSGTEIVQLTSLTPTGTIFGFNGADPEGTPVLYIVDSATPNDASTYFTMNPYTGVVTRTGVPLPPSTTFTLKVKVSDGTLDSAPGTVIINTPAAVNQPPVLTNPPNSGTEIVQLTSLTPTGTIFDFNGSDPEGSPVQYIVDSATPNDASTYFTINPTTGEVTRTGVPLPPSTTFILNVKVSDGTLDSAPGTVIINTPAAPNGAPTIINPNQTVSIPATSTGQIGGFVAIDPNGDPVTYTVNSWNPSSGSQLFYLNPQTGAVTVKPGAVLPPGSTYTLDVTATDGTLTSNTGSLVINVEQLPNDPPIFDLGSYAVTIPVSKVGAVITVNANDPNPGDTVTYSVSSWNPIDGINFFVINPATGVISVKPGVTLPANRVFVVDISANDGSLSAPSRVTITTTQDPNTAPVITNLDDVKVISTSDPAGVIFTVDSRDDQNDVVTYTGTWDNQIAGNILSFNSQTGEVSLKSTPFLQLYLNNEFTLTVTASDGQLSSVPKTLTVRITADANSPPRITNLPETVTVMENPAGVQFFTVQATDPENDNVVFSGTWEPSWAQYYFSFDENTGEVSSNPSPYLKYSNFQNQIFKLKVTAADLYGTSSTETLTFSLSPPAEENYPPVFSATNYFATVMGRQPGGPVYENLDVKVTDQDPGDTKSFSLQNTMWSSYFNINPLTGAISYASNTNLANLPNQLVLTVDVTDGYGDKDSAAVLITIQDQPPKLPGFPNLPAAINIPEGSTGTRFTVQKPPVSQQVTYSMTSSPAYAPFEINSLTGEITQTTPLDFESPNNKVFTLNVTATDNSGVSTPEGTLTLTVTNVNERPVFTQQIYQVTTNAGQVGQVVVNSLLSSVNDPDANDFIRFQIPPGPYSNFFTINPNTGAITYAQNTIGAFLPTPTRLTVQATDSRGLSSTAQIDITINGLIGTNEPPTFLNLPATKSVSKSQQPGVAIYDVNAQDPEGSSLTYSITNSNLFPQFLFKIDPSSGVVSLGNGFIIQSLPPQDFDLMISVSDGSKSTMKPLRLFIGSTTNNNQPPVFNPTFFIATVDEGPVGTVVFNAGSATDPDGDPITYQLAGSPANGFTIDQSTGVIRYSQDYSLNSGRPGNVYLSVSAYDPSGLKGDAAVFLTIRKVSTTPLTITNMPGFKILNRLGSYPVIFKVETSGGSDPKTFQLENDAGVFNMNSVTGEITLKPGMSLNQFTQANHQNSLKVIVTDSANQRQEGTLTVVVF